MFKSEEIANRTFSERLTRFVVTLIQKWLSDH